MLLKLFGHVAFLAALVLWIGGAGLIIQLGDTRRVRVGGRVRTILFGVGLIASGFAALWVSLTT